MAYPRPQRTLKTITEEAELRLVIRKVKRVGYAIEDEECDEGTRAIAAAIYGADGRIVAAVGAAGPRIRIRKRDFSKIAPLVTDAAEQISERLGYIKRQKIYI